MPISKINIRKMTIVTKAIYRFNDIPTTMLTTFFKEKEKKNPKIPTQLQRASDSQSNLE